LSATRKQQHSWTGISDDLPHSTSLAPRRLLPTAIGRSSEIEDPHDLPEHLALRTEPELQVEVFRAVGGLLPHDGDALVATTARLGGNLLNCESAHAATFGLVRDVEAPDSAAERRDLVAGIPVGHHEPDDDLVVEDGTWPRARRDIRLGDRMQHRRDV